MRPLAATTLRRGPVLLAVTLLVAALGATAGLPAMAASVSIDLCALPGSFAPLPTTDPATVIPIWGFGTPSTPGDCATATATLPGPVLRVSEGDVVTITVTNALPAGHPVRVEAPGIPFAGGPSEAAPGSSVTRTFTAGSPGTYLYQSGGNTGRQEAMGLYGALLVAPPTAGRAYDTPQSAYDVDAPLVLSAVDPTFNAAPDAFDMDRYLATYWLINGRAYPDTARISATPGQRVLLRYLNAGYDNTTMMLLGMHEHVLARDARLLSNPMDADAETIAAGATEDAFVTMPASAPPSTRGFPLYNRQLHLTNGRVSDPFHTPGGMLTFLAGP